MAYKAIKIDELTIEFDHHHIDLDDECYYIMEYKKGIGYKSTENSMILNFKKSLTYQGTNHWHYKEENIHKLKRILFAIYLPLLKSLGLKNATLVPIPPSKCRADLLHDDRMLRLLNLSFPTCDVRELLLTKESIESSHNADLRPPVHELQANLKLNLNEANLVNKKIVLFDDIVTSGAHFRACKNKLLLRYPDAEVYGFFIARRVL